MFRKVELWIVYLISFLNILVAISFGILVRQELVGTTKLGKVSKTALFLSEIPVNLKKIIKSQSSYLVNNDRFPELTDFNGIPNTRESYLLLSRFNGDLKEGIVELINLKNFKVLHTWNPDIDAFNELVPKINEFKYLKRDRNNSRQMLVHPNLTDDGGLIIGWGPLRKINSCSDLIFQNQNDDFHHSKEIDKDGNIWVPASIFPQKLPKEKVGRNADSENGYNDDGIVKLSQNGEILLKKSVSEIFIDNGLEHLLFTSKTPNIFANDPIHLNDIQPVNFDGNYWKKGDLFLSLRHQSMIILYRPETNQIIWKGTGPFFHQHDVNILNKEEISIFNNNSKFFVNGDVVDGNNQIIIYNFKTKKYSAYLNDSFIKNDIRTLTQGRGKIIAGGDVFVEETDFGRLTYLNADGSLKWSYINRSNDGKIYQLGWSRILYEKKDIEKTRNFLNTKINCND